VGQKKQNKNRALQDKTKKRPHTKNKD